MNILAMIGGLVGFIFAIAFIAIGLKRFAQGVDHTLSLSNVQVILWTGVITGTYIAMSILKQGFLADINSNLLGLMGISAGSAVGATTIRTLQQPKIPMRATDVSYTPPRTRGLLAQGKKNRRTEHSKTPNAHVDHRNTDNICDSRCKLPRKQPTRTPRHRFGLAGSDGHQPFSLSRKQDNRQTLISQNSTCFFRPCLLSWAQIHRIPVLM